MHFSKNQSEAFEWNEFRFQEFFLRKYGRTANNLGKFQKVFEANLLNRKKNVVIMKNKV